ncbi:MAG: hypothetical protein JSR21_05780 [Proteobacteria bacterium]|nr:hypothetical protein [Pseudomonadota bacterium]
MSVALIAPGRSMLLGPARAAFWRPIGGATGGSSGFSGPTPMAIAGLAGWWDAGTYASLIGTDSNPLPAWNNAVAAVSDGSGNGRPLAVYHAGSGGVAPSATPRLNGTLGGLGRSLMAPPAVPPSGTLLPQLDPDSGLSLIPADFGTSTAWTVYLVWSRPNFVQGGTATQIALLTFDGTAVIAADATAGANHRLLLFPGAAQAVLTASLERRHTHSVIVRHTPGTGIDVWLDGSQVAAGVSNPLASDAAGTLLLLHSGKAGGGAQCWFHEAALWEHALDSADVTTLLSAAQRWRRGARKGVQLVVMGQSNAGYSLTDGAWHLLAQGIAWHLGALAYNVIGSFTGGGGSSYTCVGGHGISNVPFAGQVLYPGSFLADPGDGSDPGTWSLGADGDAVQTYLAAQAQADLGDVALLVWPWTESDSARAYAEKSEYANAVTNLVGRVRSMLSRSAAALPMMWWNAIPFGSGTDAGTQMVREVAAQIVSDPTQNVVIGLPQTADSNPRGGNWDPSTGIFVAGSGDYNHRDATDNLRFGRLASAVAARAVMAAIGGDTETAIPSGIPTAGGPSIVHAYQQTAHSTTLVLTILHDAGNDLIVPLQAATGQGFAVMDGGSVQSPGPMIQATACVRIDPTHLQLTLSNAPTNAQAGLLLFYPYGISNIFRGNAVTDNFASVAKPLGWDIGADLGSAWTLNFPLAATTWPIPVSSAAI